MITTFIAGLSVLILLGIVNLCISYLLIEKINNKY